jgi:hypothetical protein
MSIALVSQGSSSGTNAAAATTGSFDSTGATLIVVAFNYSPDSPSPTVTDSKGNTYTLLSPITALTGALRGRLAYCVNPIVGSGHTVTVNAATVGYPTLTAYAFSGAGAYDSQETGDEQGGTSMQPGSITPSEDNCLLVVAGFHDQATTDNSVNSSFSTLDKVVTSGSNDDLVSAYKIQTTAGAENPTLSWTTFSWSGVVMASFKSAAPSGPTISSATANVDGDQLTVVLSEATTITDADGLTVETIGGATPGLTYVSGSGSDTFLFSVAPRIGGASVPLLQYNSAAGNIADLGDVTDHAIVNNSRKPIPPIEYVVPTIPATLTALLVGKTRIDVTSAAELTSLLTGGTVDGTTLAAATDSTDAVIVLANTSYVGEFTFPALGSAFWVFVVSEDMDSLPASGTRTTEADRAFMPLFTASDNGGSYNFFFATLHMAFGAEKYRFIGVSATYPLTSDIGLGLFVAGKENADLTGEIAADADIVTDVILDRCEFYGRDGAGYTDRKGVNFDVDGGAIIDGRILGIAGASGDDPMGIMVTFSGGNLLLQNLEVTASGENIIFGGTDGYRDVHENIVIRRCHLYKPRHWFAFDPSFDSYDRTIKNLLELKKASKVLIEGCVLEDVGESDSSQAYTAFVLTVRNQDGGDPGAVVEHVEARNCLVRNCGATMTITGENDGPTSLETNHIYAHDILSYNQNYWEQYGAITFPAYKISQMFEGRVYPNIRIEHVTAVIGPEGTANEYGNFVAIVAENADVEDMLPGLVIQNNIAEGYAASTLREAIMMSRPGFTWAANVGIPLITGDDYTVSNNVITGEDGDEQARYPAGNFFESTYSTIGFADYAGATEAADFELTSGSYRAGQANDATDGTDLGANIDAIVAATAGTISGVW